MTNELKWLVRCHVYGYHRPEQNDRTIQINKNLDDRLRKRIHIHQQQSIDGSDRQRIFHPQRHRSPHLPFLPEGPSRKQPCGSFPKRKRGADQPLLSIRCVVRGEHQRRRAALQVQRKGIGPQVRAELVRPWRAAQRCSHWQVAQHGPYGREVLWD